MKKSKILIILLLSLLLVGCGEPRQEEKKKDTPIMVIGGSDDTEENKDSNTPSDPTKDFVKYVSYDTKVSIKVPNSWERVPEGELNEEAILELAGRSEHKYLMIISNSKTDFPTYDKWEELAIDRDAELYEFDKNNVKNAHVGGYDGKMVEFTYGEGKDSIYGRIYFLKVSDSYLQVFFWTNASSKTDTSKEFYDIIGTIEEVRS